MLARLSAHVLVALASLALSPSARADWDWTAVDGCLEGARAQPLVESTLGAAVDARIAVSAHLEGRARAWRASITVTGPDGVARLRELESTERTCAALDDAIVVVAALLIDEVRALPTPVVLAITPADLAIEAVEGIETSDALEPPVASEPPWAATIRLDALARLDELPGLTGAPVLSIEITPPSAVPIALSVGFWPPVEALVAARGGRFYGALVGLGACPAARIDPAVELGGCGTVAATYVIADGVSVEVPQHAEGLVLSVEATFFARLHVAGPLWLRASVGALVPLTRPRATIDVGGTQVLVHEVAPVVPEGSFGAELRFP